jgi:hypothetical protein
MKRILLSVLIVSFIALSVDAQLKIIEHGLYQFIDGQPVLVEPAGTEDLGGTTIELVAEDLTGDNEHQVWVVNESNETLTLRCVRTELSVLPETENNVCWGLCPISTQTAGDQPVWIVGGTAPAFTETLAPGDTAITFAFHYEPNQTDGCSLFKIEFFDDATTSILYGSFNLNWEHSSSTCVTSVDEFQNIETSLSPNPASNITALTMSGVDKPVDIQIFDLLGQTIAKDRFNPVSADRYLIDTNDMGNGIYFVSIQDENQVLKTMKLVVKH